MTTTGEIGGLDALVAEKVMGWYLKGRRWIDPARKSFAGYTSRPVYDACSDCDFPIWEPSVDISAAWDIVEKLRHEWRFLFQETPGRQWRAVFSSHSDHELAKTADAETAPTAICLAALKVVGANP